MPAPSDEVTLKVNGAAWKGWTSIRITRGVERCPSDFAVAVTELYPDTAGIDIKPGDPVVVMIGTDPMITGYVDRYNASIDPQSHMVEITGRGKCQDLVDCSALFDGMQISNSTTLGIAQLVAKRFGITVTSLDGDGYLIPQFNSVLSETPYQIIERTGRYSGLLAYEGRDGNMILSRVGKLSMASGFVQGVNVQAARFGWSIDQRFHEIIVVMNAINTVFAQLSGAAMPVGLSAANTIAKVTDDAIRAARLRIVVSEQGFQGIDLSVTRANWEKARRMGRSFVVTLTTDSWRDSAGTLWAPNAKVKLDLPALKVPPDLDWVISEVSFLKDQSRGTVAELTMMPSQAFSPEPINLFPVDQQVANDLAHNTNTKPTGPS